MKLWRKQSPSVKVALLLKNVFARVTGQFCCILHPGKCAGSGEVLLLGIDQTLMQEQLFQVVQVDPGRVRTVCLAFPCIYWDGDGG